MKQLYRLKFEVTEGVFATAIGTLKEGIDNNYEFGKVYTLDKHYTSASMYFNFDGAVYVRNENATEITKEEADSVRHFLD